MAAERGVGRASGGRHAAWGREPLGGSRRPWRWSHSPRVMRSHVCSREIIQYQSTCTTVRPVLNVLKMVDGPSGTSHPILTVSHVSHHALAQRSSHRGKENMKKTAAVSAAVHGKGEQQRAPVSDAWHVMDGQARAPPANRNRRPPTSTMKIANSAAAVPCPTAATALPAPGPLETATDRESGVATSRPLPRPLPLPPVVS